MDAICQAAPQYHKADGLRTETSKLTPNFPTRYSVALHVLSVITPARIERGGGTGRCSGRDVAFGVDHLRITLQAADTVAYPWLRVEIAESKIEIVRHLPPGLL